MDARTRSYLDRAAEAVAAGRFEESAGYERIAADRVHALGDPPEEGAALLDAGANRQLARGDVTQAAAALHKLVALRRRLGDPAGEEDATRLLALARGSHPPPAQLRPEPAEAPAFPPSA